MTKPQHVAQRWNFPLSKFLNSTPASTDLMTALPDPRPCSPDDLAACIALFESNVPDDFGARERTDCLAGIDEEGTRYFVREDADGARRPARLRRLRPIRGQEPPAWCGA